MATMTPLQSVTLTGSQTTITFSAIDPTYTDLRVIVSPFSSTNAMNYSCQVGYNSVDTGSHYSFMQMRGNGSAIASGETANGTYFNNVNQGVHTTNPHIYTYDFLSYSNTSLYKTVLCRFNENDGGSGYVAASIGTWRGMSGSSTEPINIISFTAISGSFTAGSTFSLYGIRSGGTAKAAGGDIVVSDGTYWYHAFLRTGRFTPAIPGLSCDVLSIGGGGSGGAAGGSGAASTGGGGGAGGVIASSANVLTTATYPVLIGAGGSITAGSDMPGNPGNATQFGSLTAALGGGFGGSYVNGIWANGGNGGSGGGGGNNPGGGSPGSGGTGSQGFNGASGTNSSYGGGGGGAGGAASAYHGGAGTNTVTNWGSLASMFTYTGLGVGGYIAGGGGGGNAGGGAGSGGGGTGNSGAAATAGTAFTGSGGGAGTGSYNYPTGYYGQPGGSGLVVVRYGV